MLRVSLIKLLIKNEYWVTKKLWKQNDIYYTGINRDV